MESFPIGVPGDLTGIILIVMCLCMHERRFIVSGATDLDEITELIGVHLFSDDFHTISGFVFGLFGRLSIIGEQIRYHDLRFLILNMEGRKISKIKITKL